MEVNQQDNSVFMCVEAFKRQENHDEALRLLPFLQQPATIRTDHCIVPAYECTNVSLLHLAALHGWSDIVASLVCEYNCSSQCCDSGGQTPLHYAAHGGSLPVVQYLITEQHCDPLQCSNYIFGTPFLYACEAGHLEIVEYLITKRKFDPASSNKDESEFPINVACLGGQLNVINYLITNEYCTSDCKGMFEQTPLHYACYKGHMEILEYLIKGLGCDPASPDNDGDLPIHTACLGGQLNVVKYLIANKYCTPDCKGEFARTPLHYACRQGHMEIVDYLIKELCCDPASSDINGDLPIHIACLGGQLNVVKYLITNRYCTPDCKGKFGRTSLYNACGKGHMEIVEYFIKELGCDPASPDIAGSLPIHIACFCGQLHVVRYLFREYNCSPKSLCFRGRTLLHLACYNGHMDMIEYLIKELGCNPASADNDGDLPIHIACRCGQLNVVKYLITNKHCIPHCKGEFGQTPLHIACENGHLEILEYLIEELYCDPASPDSDGDLPIHIAFLRGHLNVVKYFITNDYCTPDCKGKFGRTLLHNACNIGHMDIVEYLTKELGCDPASPDNSGDLPIHIACLRGHLNVVKYLISNKYSTPDCKGKLGRSPLHHACYKGHTEIVDYLIKEVGCDPALPDNDGNLPIHIACLGGQLNVHVVKYLITNKYCTPDCKGKFGRSPLRNACFIGHMEIVEYLIKELGCDPALPDSYGDLPIHIACLGGHLIVVEYLITNKYCTSGCKGMFGWTPLHNACYSGHLDIIKYLISKLGCDPAPPDINGDLPIHIACVIGQLNVVKYLVINKYCSPDCKGKWGRTPLHHACDKGHINIIQYLISEAGCILTLLDNSGNMAIHTAVLSGQLNVVKYLISNQYFSPNCSGKWGQTPLHLACQSGHMNIIQYLFIKLNVPTEVDIESLVNIVCSTGRLNILKYLINTGGYTENCGRKLLFNACENGYVNIVEYLVSELGCDPASPDSDGNLPLHVTCLYGHLNVVKYLITNRYCSPYSTDKWGRTLLHHACVNGHMNIVCYLIKELGCNPTVLDDNHSTPLHLACSSGHIQVVQWLLRDGRVDLMSVNKSGCTPLDYAKLSANSYELLEVFQLFQPLLESRRDYPIHTYTKAVLTGNSGAGKTTLAQAFINQDTAVSSHWYQTFRKHPRVEQLTAGIVSHLIPSHNMILYDLAGHTEFYFSQSTIMEVIVQNSMAIFINLVDLSTSEDEIKHAVYYWLNFIEDATCKSDEKSSLLMVGSHADKLSNSEKEAKQSLVSNLVHRRVTRLEYIGFVSMDCRKLGTKASKNVQFFAHVSTCQQSILAQAPSLSIYCHTLYSFLQTKMNIVACQLQTLTTSLTSEGSVIPTDVSFVSELLESLNNKGVIVYLKNRQCLEKSWLVVKKELVLKDINVVLFSPKYFKEHREIVSSTGIIRLSSFHQLFPKHNPDMLVELMVSLEFCLRVNLSGVETNLQAIVSTTQPESLDQLLFFPSLLKVQQPRSVTSDIQQSCGEHFRFGWCLGCKDYGYRYFTVRFLHVLLLRLAYTFPLPCENISQTHALHGLERRCTIWKSGISWNNDDGIRTVVEVIQQSRWVVVTMFHNKDTRPVEYSRHRSAVIRLVLNLQQELASDLDKSEYLISPSLLQQQCPIQFLPETSLFAIKDVAKSVLHDKPFILGYNDDKQKIRTSDAVFFDPYHCLSFFSVCELMDSSKNDQPVSPALLSEVREFCQQPQLESQSYSSLREHLDKMSLFAGRNPLVVAELEPVTLSSAQRVQLESVKVTSPASPIEEPVPTVDLSDIPDGTLDIQPHLSVLLTTLNNVMCQWMTLGVHLGVNYFALKVIKKNRPQDVEECMMEMLEKWLKGQEGECNRDTLKTALQKINCRISE